MSSVGGSRASAMLDALHAELLVDVQELARNVEALKKDVPKLAADVLVSAEAVKAAASKSVADFQAMGQALLNVMNKNTDSERGAAIEANKKSAGATKVALEGFTKYFWLIAAIGGANLLLLVALLAVLLRR